MLTASYTPSGTGRPDESSTDFALAYTGVEGLTVGYATGEDMEKLELLKSDELTTMYAKYAFGSFTVGYSHLKLMVETLT